MEDQVQRLVGKVWDKFLQTPQDQRLMIAIAGIPGSGKTTLAQTVTTTLNTRHATSSAPSSLGPIAAYIPMDGYHLTRAQLSALPDPSTAHARRGAEFTFDGAAFLLLVQALRRPLAPLSAAPSPASTSTIYAPSFDHALKDPVADDIAIQSTQHICVFEGNYLLLDRGPWAAAARLMDERWFVSVDFGVARRRLVRRHMATGVTADEESAGRRADENDLVNGAEIVACMVEGVDEVVKSREDDAWVHG